VGRQPTVAHRFSLVECATDLPDDLIFRIQVKPFSEKYFAFPEGQIRRKASPIPCHRRGASRSSRDVGAGCDGRDGTHETKRAEADGQVVWSWPPDAGVKP
jgi:hypothetical protein